MFPDALSKKQAFGDHGFAQCTFLRSVERRVATRFKISQNEGLAGVSVVRIHSVFMESSPTRRVRSNSYCRRCGNETVSPESCGETRFCGVNFCCSGETRSGF